MKQIKLFDSELKLIELIWDNEPIVAKELCKVVSIEIGWNKNTTYTVLKKLVEKLAVKREEPNFICTTLVSKEQIQLKETNNLINKFFEGSRKVFFSNFIGKEKLTSEEIYELKRIIEKSGQ